VIWFLLGVFSIGFIFELGLLALAFWMGYNKGRANEIRHGNDHKPTGIDWSKDPPSWNKPL
jgi:hypothetical protein